MKLKVVYVDMDDVLVDFQSGIDSLSDEEREVYKDNIDNAPGIFSKMQPLDGAIEGYKKLTEYFDVYILSTAPWNNPSAWSDKLLWVQKHLGDIAYKRLILSSNKHLNAGDYLIDDRASRELQALSLVTQGTFYSEFALGNNIVSGTLAERASSLVNDAFSDENGKFQVGLNYTTGDRTPDQETADRFGLTITTQISNRVLINGQVGVPIGGVSESVVVGDVEIEFLLNEEGTLRASIFNRENNIQYIGEELGYTQGAGLSYNVDFNTFKELIDKITNRQVRIDADIQTEKQPETLAPDYIKFPGGDGGN